MSASKVLIIDEQNRYLLMWRSNHPYFGNDPDLPGGTIEKGETASLAAVREVEEEAGITIAETDLDLLYQSPVSPLGGARTSLYLVRINPRPEVVMSWEHSSYEWLSRDEFLEAVKNAKDTYMHIVHEAVSKLPLTR